MLTALMCSNIGLCHISFRDPRQMQKFLGVSACLPVCLPICLYSGVMVKLHRVTHSSFTLTPAELPTVLNSRISLFYLALLVSM